MSPTLRPLLLLFNYRDDGEAVDTDGEDTCLQRCGRCCCFSTTDTILELEAVEATVDDGEIGDEESCNSLA